MKKFVVEKNRPEAGNFSIEELHTITQTFRDAIDKLKKSYHRVQLFVTDDKIRYGHIVGLCCVGSFNRS